MCVNLYLSNKASDANNRTTTIKMWHQGEETQTKQLDPTVPTPIQTNGFVTRKFPRKTQTAMYTAGAHHSNSQVHKIF
jgi:hypothetical protein